LPKYVFRMRNAIVKVLDIEHRVDPYIAQADAFVWTDKGIHLFYLGNNYPSQELVRLADPLHMKLNGEEFSPVFFLSKTDHSKPRSCVGITTNGIDLANEYNQMVTRCVLSEKGWAELIELAENLEAFEKAKAYLVNRGMSV